MKNKSKKLVSYFIILMFNRFKLRTKLATGCLNNMTYHWGNMIKN